MKRMTVKPTQSTQLQTKPWQMLLAMVRDVGNIDKAVEGKLGTTVLNMEADRI